MKFTIVLVVLNLALSDGFSISENPKGGVQTSRKSFLAGLLTSAIVAPQVATAKEVDPAVKGTKQDPAYEACVSECLYACTKPKGAEQRSRAECIPGRSALETH